MQNTALRKGDARAGPRPHLMSSGNWKAECCQNLSLGFTSNGSYSTMCCGLNLLPPCSLFVRGPFHALTAHPFVQMQVRALRRGRGQRQRQRHLDVFWGERRYVSGTIKQLFAIQEPREAAFWSKIKQASSRRRNCRAQTHSSDIATAYTSQTLYGFSAL